MNKRPAYLLPTGTLTEDVICIPVYIPDDPACIAAFWGQYDDLTAWVAWEQDEDKRAKDVAAAFKVARDRSRDEWIENGGCGNEEMLRQNPTDPCLIERSTDGGETWVTLADLSLCKNTEYDPFNGQTLPQEAPALAAASICLELLRLVNWGIDYAEQDEIIPTYAGYLSNWTNNNPMRAAAVWYDGYEDHLQDINDFGSTSEWVPLYNFLTCHMQSTRSPECNSVYCWLNEAAEDLYDWLNESSEWVFNKLEETARTLGPAGLTNMAAGGGSDRVWGYRRVWGP